VPIDPPLTDEEEKVRRALKAGLRLTAAQIQEWTGLEPGAVTRAVLGLRDRTPPLAYSDADLRHGGETFWALSPEGKAD
jgi:hypothetical protein